MSQPAPISCTVLIGVSRSALHFRPDRGPAPTSAFHPKLPFAECLVSSQTCRDRFRRIAQIRPLLPFRLNSPEPRLTPALSRAPSRASPVAFMQAVEGSAVDTQPSSIAEDK